MTSQQWSDECAPALRRVFRTLEPFQAPVADRLRERAILFPVPYTLEMAQFDAVFAAARAVGDASVCVSIAEGRDQLIMRGDVVDWELQAWEYEEYRCLPRLGVLENVVYSPRGEWGLLISHEQHAVAAGEARFLRALAEKWPDWESALNRFLEYWRFEARRSNASIAWLMPLLVHVYGADRADALSRAG